MYSLRLCLLINVNTLCYSIGNKKAELTLKNRVYQCEKCNLVKADRDFVASINLHNQLGRVHSEVMPVKITAMNQQAKLVDSTSIVEAGSKLHV